MLKKWISFALIFIIIACMIIPTYADETTSWVRYSIGDGSKVTIEWSSYKQVKELLIKRSCNGGTYLGFRSFKSNVPNNGSFSFVETEVGNYSYSVDLYGKSGEDTILLASSTENYSVKGTGKPKITLEFRDSYTETEKNTSVERIKNWVNIHNLGTTDLELSRMKIKYFFTIDGEPKIVADTKNTNAGQERIEQSDAKLNPFPYYAEYTLGNKDVQNEDVTRMNFYKMPLDVYNENNVKVADYYCETYFENTSAAIDSAYYLMLQPAFHKIGLNVDESNFFKDTYIRNYYLLNDYSYNNSENIAVYYDNEKIWGNDPSIIVPKNLKGEYKDYSVHLEWTASPGATKYKVYRSESIDGTYTSLSESVTGTTYKDGTVIIPTENTSKDYFYKVSAYYNGVWSDFSNIARVAVTKLIAPSNLTAKNIDNKEVELNWDAINGVTGYNVYRSESQDGTYEKINKEKVTQATYRDNVSKQGNTDIEKTYYYKVTAVYNGERESNYSDSVAVTIFNLTAPDDLKAEIINFKDVRLTWNASKDAQGYNVYRCEGIGGTFHKINSEVLSGTTFTDYTTRIARNSIEYYYKVTAVYNGADSKYSNSVNVSMPILAAPANLQAEYIVDDNEVKLTWTPSSGAQSYEIWRSEAADGTGFNIGSVNAVGMVATQTFTDNSLPDAREIEGKKYYYKVVAKFGEESSGDSDIKEVTIEIKYWDCECKILSDKKRNDFSLGTYIPVSLTITIKRDITDLTILLDTDLTNPLNDTNKNNKNLNAVLVSKQDINTTRLFKTEWTRSGSKITDLSKVTIRDNQSISINDISFKKGDIIKVDFALKTSADQEVINDGIDKYYGDIYKLNFTIKGNSDSISDSAAVDVKITKPDKIK